MLFDANLLAVALREVRSILPARLDEVLEDPHGNVLLALRGRPGRATLLLSCDPRFYRLHLTHRTGERPRRGPFAQLALHVTGAHVEAADQPPGDRIAVLRLSAPNRIGEVQPLLLVHELFGPAANLTLVDGERRVVWTLRPRRRTVGDRFPDLPPDGPPVAAGPVAEALAPDARARLEAVLEGRSEPTPTVYGGQGAPVAAYPLPLWPGGRPAPSLAAALDEAYGELEAAAGREERRRALAARLAEAVSRLRRRLEKQERELAEAQAAERLRAYGELLLAYGWQLPPGSRELCAERWDTGEKVVVPLDPEISPAENARRYFEQYRRATRRRERLEPEVAAARQRLSRLEALASSLPDADEDTLDLLAQEVRQLEGAQNRAEAEAALPPYRFRTSGGVDVFVGRNQRQNDELTFRLARPDDIWVHVKDYPGSHVVLRATHPTESDIVEACLLAAYFSKARGGSQVPVDFTRRRFVRRQSGAGPGRVLYERQETRFVSTDDPRLAELLRQLPDQEAPR